MILVVLSILSCSNKEKNELEAKSTKFSEIMTSAIEKRKEMNTAEIAKYSSKGVTDDRFKKFISMMKPIITADDLLEEATDLNSWKTAYESQKKAFYDLNHRIDSTSKKLYKNELLGYKERRMAFFKLLDKIKTEFIDDKNFMKKYNKKSSIKNSIDNNIKGFKLAVNYYRDEDEQIVKKGPFSSKGKKPIKHYF